MGTTSTKIPSFCSTPPQVEPQLKRLLQGMVEALEVRLGRRGDPKDRAITLRELIDSGLAKELRDNPFDPDTGVGATDFESSAQQTDEVDSTIPPAPTGLAIAGAFTKIILSWDSPQMSNLAYSEVYRGTTDSLGNAVRHDTTRAFVWADTVDPGETFFYWVRHVSTSDIIGPFAGSVTDTTALLSGATIADAAITNAKIANLAADKITAGVIASARITADSIASNLITAAKINMTDLFGETITLDTDGHIKQGQSDYATGTGFFLGKQPSTSGTKFSIGNPAGEFLTWDGSILHLHGQLAIKDIFSSNSSGLVVGYLTTVSRHIGASVYTGNAGTTTWTTARSWQMNGTGTMTIKVTGEGYAGSADEFMAIRIMKNGTTTGTHESGAGVPDITPADSSVNTQTYASASVTRTWINATVNDGDTFYIQIARPEMDSGTEKSEITSVTCNADLQYGRSWTVHNAD